MLVFFKELIENFFIHIISAKDLLFFVLWCIIDTVLFLTITRDFNLKSKDAKNKQILILQYKQIILSALLVLCINIFIKNSSIPVGDLFKTVGFELEINTETTLSILLTLLYIPTLFKITKEFKKNSEKKNKVEEEK